MKRLLTAFILTVSLLFLASCEREEEGILAFYNATETPISIDIDHVEYIVPPNTTLERRWSIRSSLFSAGEIVIDVEIKEKLFLFPMRYTVRLRAGTRLSRTIEYDAAGLQIYNDTSSYIVEVYISPSASSLWGSNRLTLPIAPGHDVKWNLTPGLWDIKVITGAGHSFTVYDQRFYIGVLRSFSIGSTGCDITYPDAKVNRFNISDKDKHRIELIR